MLDKVLQKRLARLRQADLYRERRLVTGTHGPTANIDGRDCAVFCSNDYLGLAADPALVDAMQRAAARVGIGSGASQLITGYNAEHRALEEELADFIQRPRALLFSSGTLANLGVITALVGRDDTVVSDKLNHASLIDAIRLSGAWKMIYDHASLPGLQRALEKRRPGNALVVTDALFSMDGDCAPLAGIAALASRRGAWLMVDDAHGFGVLGPQGRGSLAAAGPGVAEAPVLMATLGKALGGFGAFVAGSEPLIEYLIQRARSLIYTTAPPPALAAAMRIALQRVREDEWRREKLFANIRRFREGAEQLGICIGASHDQTPIQPLIVGDEGRALALSQALYEAGFMVTAIRPPTVPEDTARLRITLSTAHNEQQVDGLLQALWDNLKV